MTLINHIEHPPCYQKGQITKSTHPWRKSEPIYNPSFQVTTANTLSHGAVWFTPVTAILQTVQLPEIEYMRKLEYGDQVVELDRGLILQVEVLYEEGKYIAYDHKFGIYGSGESREEALSDFNQFFVEFFAEIVESPDEELPTSTVEFKNTLAAFGTLKRV